MKRRSLLSLAGGVVLGAALPVLAQTRRLARIGVLSLLPPSHPGGAANWKAFYDEMRSREWVEGRNLEVLGRYTMAQSGVSAGYAKELVMARVDVIVATIDRLVAAASNATRSIPIVMANSTFAAELGLIASLARPGGNVTGVSNQVLEIIGKLYEFMKALRPDLKKHAVIWLPADQGSALAFKEEQVAAERLGISLVSLPIKGAEDMEQALAAAKRAGVQALSVHPSLELRFKPFADWAIENRIAVIGDPRNGYLMSYWPDIPDLFRIAATFVDRILRGAKPAELPVQQPTKFNFIVNAKTARALGLTIPPSVLVRADEVIQ